MIYGKSPRSSSSGPWIPGLNDFSRITNRLAKLSGLFIISFITVTSMATTIKTGFQILNSNLNITGLQESTVSTRQTNIREAVEAEMTVLDSFVAGSYRRNTLIAPLGSADVEIFVVLSSSYFEQNGQASLLDKVKRVLRKTYTKTPEISRNGQAVTIAFTDFKADVVPAFNRQGGGFLIPDSSRQRWISTDPKKHIEIWQAANKSHSGDLIPLMKMIKGWNVRHSSLLRSFHLETIVLNVLDGITITDFPSGTRYVFDKARAKIPYQLSDPAGYGGDVGAYISTQQDIKDVVGRLDAAYTKAVEAEQFAVQGKIDQAISKWRIIFGDYFPSYG
jgi:hypothetical protein